MGKNILKTVKVRKDACLPMYLFADVEVTKEMTEAGARAFYACEPLHMSEDEIFAEVFAAMMAAR